MTDFERLTKRVGDIERQILLMLDRETEDAKVQLQLKLTNDAFVYSVRSLGAEVAEREGISEELFLSRFQALMRWHLDRLMRTASDNAPSLLAQLDGRSPDEIPTDEAPPRVLAPPDL